MGDFRGSQNVVYPSATGGSVSTSGNFKVHVFNSSGTFSVSTVGNQGTTLEYLIIAGGGAEDNTRVVVEEQVVTELVTQAFQQQIILYP